MRLQDKVCETIERPSVCPSVRLFIPSVGRRMPLQRVCCCGPGGQDTSIDRLLHGQRSAANASSATLSADVGS